MTTKPAYAFDPFNIYQTLFQAIHLGIHIYHLENPDDDATLRLVSANTTSETFTGIPPREIVGHTIDENFPRLRALGLPQKYAEVIRTGKPHAFDTVYYEDERVEKGVFAVHVYPLQDNHAAVCFENITTRLELETALTKSEKHLKSLFDHMQSGFAYHQLITDDQGKPIDYIFLEVNRAFERLTGLNRKDIIGQPVTKIHPELKEMDFDWIGTYGKVALSGEPLRFEQYFEPQQHWYQINAYCPHRGYFAITFEDITQHKNIEDDLRKSKEQFHELFHQMPSGGVIYEAIDDGADFIIREINQAAERIDDIESETVLGARLTEVFPGIKEFGLLDVLRRVWKTGKAEYLPEKLYQDDRIGKGWRENRVYRLPSGEIVAIYNDVSERVRAKNELNQALLRLQEIAKAGNVGLWDWNLITNEVHFSEEYKHQIGYKKDEISDTFLEWQKRVHPDDLEKTEARVQKSIDELKEDHAAEFRFRHKDGSYRWIYAQASVQGDQQGKPIRMMGSHIDITARKQAELELQQNRNRLRSMLDNLIDAVLVVDHNGTVRFANSSACSFFGRPKDELVGSEFGFPVTLEKIFDITAISPDGRPCYGEAKATGGEWNNENVYLISIRDITERKRAILEREKLQEQMSQMDKIESIGKLAGGIAHDFNNMLSVIMGFSKEVYNQLHENDPLREDINEVIEAGRRSAALTRQLLAFSRRQTLEPVVIALNTIILDMEKMLRRLIGEDIELKITLDEKLAPTLVDPGQIEQVIVNLAVNAKDAMPLGGKLTIETMNFTVDPQYTQTHVTMTPGKYAMLSITDNGHGMDEETRSKIYEPFFSTKVKGKGTGLGLSTVYGIVKQSGGYIWVYSEPGHGTTFKLYFPISAESISLAKSIRLPKSTGGEGESILVVEDEPSMRKLCQRMLTQLGYKVRVAANGGEALLLVEEENYMPDLVITDVIMPEMNGKVLVERLQQRHPDLKVLYMSGYTDNAIVHHGVLDSGIPFVQKPFTQDTIAKKLRLLFAGK